MSFEDRVQVQTIIYGPHVDLHKQILDSFRICVPDGVNVKIWCNQIGPESKALLHKIIKPGWYCFFSGENVPKYQVLRNFWAEIKKPESPIDWVVFFDDDSFIWQKTWWDYMKRFIESREEAKWNIKYIGPISALHMNAKQWKFIRESPWYQGKEPRIFKDETAIIFAHGAYFWIHKDAIVKYDLPDPRINHNNTDSPCYMNGDVLIGEILYQNGIEIIDCRYGVRFNTAFRRGIGSGTYNFCPHCLAKEGVHGIKQSADFDDRDSFQPEGRDSFWFTCKTCKALWTIASYPGHTVVGDMEKFCGCDVGKTCFK